MSTVNVMAREVAAKLVFYGPGLSGKTTSLKCIYESIKPSLRGELMSLPTEADRTLFFDFLPVRVERVGEYALRLALYTVPGQVFYNATRKLVLQGADGVIFVADSNPGADDANRESMANLTENLAEQGVRLEGFPLVIQYNKRDLPNALPIEHMRAALNPRGVPDFETSATAGQGVLDAMKAMIRLVILDLRARRVVPSPKSRKQPVAEPMALAKDEKSSLEAQLQEHLDAATPTLPTPPPEAPRPLLGPVAALAPAALIDPSRAAEVAFAQGDYDGCVRACLETVTRGVAFAGDGNIGSQSYLLGLDGRDVLELQTRAARGGARIDDAAFALYVLAQTFVRLTHAGLPTPQQ
ncbi:MAG: ADP-ribosylation factor-like protein [Myxococcota bacterium]